MADYALALLPILALATLTWLASVPLRDVSIADPVWSLLFVAAALTWWWNAETSLSPRATIGLALLGIWALRLAAHLANRKWGEPEDHRYAAMRAHRGAKFWWLSLFTVFCLQAVLAWAIAAPLYALVRGPHADLTWVDGVAIAVWLLGFSFQAVGDVQLARFKRSPRQSGAVLDTGLWRYTRHPNYFGEFCMWWGLWLLATGSGGAWTVFSPVLMTFLLLRVSGVALLEQDIAERRPGYADYVRRTNAFFPGPPQSS